MQLRHGAKCSLSKNMSVSTALPCRIVPCVPHCLVQAFPPAQLLTPPHWYMDCTRIYRSRKSWRLSRAGRLWCSAWL